MIYTVKLHSIKCLQAQELDGDEIILTFNGQPVWSSKPFKMTESANHDHTVSEFDFTSGRKQTQSGWELITPYNPLDFVFTADLDLSFFELWEDDALLGVESLGESPVSLRDAGHGHISVAFARDGAHYLLTYEVSHG